MNDEQRSIVEFAQARVLIHLTLYLTEEEQRAAVDEVLKLWQ